MTPGAALVTGGAHRLGRALALALADMGWAVALHYNSRAAEAEEVARLARAEGTTAVTLQADLLDWDQTESLIPHAVETLGQPLTLLINNASIFEYDTIHSATEQSWDRHINSNLRAPFQLTQSFAAQAPKAVMDPEGEPMAQAAIINMIDQRVRKLTPEFMTYTLAKSALWTMTQTTAQALAPHVRVNAIGPGPTLQGTRQSAEHFARQRAATILERGSDPSEICKAMQFILGIPGFTGQLLCMDGGQHLGWKTPDVLGVE